MALRQHPDPIPNVRPGLEYLEKHIVKDDEYGHWFWCERKGKRTHDLSTGQALVAWSVPATHKTDFVSRGRYNVARLLIEHVYGAVEPRAKIESLCGLPQCVNPQHWGRRERVSPFRLARLMQRWCLVIASTGREVAEPQVARLRSLDGTVHVIRAVPREPILVVCGAAVDFATALVIDAAVTCKEGC